MSKVLELHVWGQRQSYLINKTANTFLTKYVLYFKGRFRRSYSVNYNVKKPTPNELTAIEQEVCGMLLKSEGVEYLITEKAL